MTQLTEKVTTVRLAPAIRSRLKILAAARHQTMEDALAEAVDLWSAHSIGKTNGKVREEVKRMHAQCDRIAGSGNERVIQSAMTVLDCMTLGL